MESTYTPCRVAGNEGCEVAEIAPVSGMTREAAIDYARTAYGNDDAGIINDSEQWAVWCGVPHHTPRCPICAGLNCKNPHDGRY